MNLFSQVDWSEAAGIYGPLVVVIGLLAGAASRFATWLDNRAKAQAEQFKKDIAELKGQVEHLEEEVRVLKNGHFACRTILVRGLNMNPDSDMKRVLNEALEVLR